MAERRRSAYCAGGCSSCCEPVPALPSATLRSAFLGRMGIVPSGLCAVGHTSGCTAPK
jgi:hypothetical protein